MNGTPGLYAQRLHVIDQIKLKRRAIRLSVECGFALMAEELEGELRGLLEELEHIDDGIASAAPRRAP